MELFAGLIDLFKQTDDIHGQNLFQSTLISYGSNLRTGHGLKGCPALYAGGAATNLKYGEHIVLQKKDTPLANYWLTLVQQAGVPLDRFSHRVRVAGKFIRCLSIFKCSQTKWNKWLPAMKFTCNRIALVIDYSSTLQKINASPPESVSSQNCSHSQPFESNHPSILKENIEGDSCRVLCWTAVKNQTVSLFNSVWRMCGRLVVRVGPKMKTCYVLRVKQVLPSVAK